MKTAREYALENMDWGGKHQVSVLRGFYPVDEDARLGAISNVEIRETISFKAKPYAEIFMWLLELEGVEFTYQYKWLWPWTQWAERKRQREL